MNDAVGRENPWDESTKKLFPLIQTSEFGQLDSTLKSEFAALFDHLMQFLLTLERLRDFLSTWVHPCLREKKCTYLWSRQQSPESRFSSLFPINLWTKTRDSDILQRRLRKIYNPSGRSLSSISHEDLTVFSCEAGYGVLFFYCSSDRRRLDFCVQLWERGSRRRSVDTENKVGLDRLKVLNNEGIVGVCPQLQLF